MLRRQPATRTHNAYFAVWASYLSSRKLPAPLCSSRSLPLANCVAACTASAWNLAKFLRQPDAEKRHRPAPQEPLEGRWLVRDGAAPVWGPSVRPGQKPLELLPPSLSLRFLPRVLQPLANDPAAMIAASNAAAPAAAGRVTKRTGNASHSDELFQPITAWTTSGPYPDATQTIPARGATPTIRRTVDRTPGPHFLNPRFAKC